MRQIHVVVHAGMSWWTAHVTKPQTETTSTENKRKQLNVTTLDHKTLIKHGTVWFCILCIYGRNTHI